MTFRVAAGSSDDFNSWISQARHAARPLDMAAYNRLAEPSKYVEPDYYSSVQSNLYNYITVKYMTPMTAPRSTATAGAKL
jgi:cytochrome o ubiquinol oxidase subunit 2